MITILVASQKGGSGKTTLAAHLSVEAERAGDGPVWIIDTDQQATLSRWHERRKAETPQRGEIRFDRLASGLASLASKGASFCFLDTAPTISEQTAALITLADFVLIPVRPSPNDLWAVSATVQLVKAGGKPFAFVLTQAKPQASITAQATAILSQSGPVAQAFIADRVTYAAAMTSGQTAPEIAPRGPAAKEIADLWHIFKSLFNDLNLSATKSRRQKKIAHG